MSRRVRRQDRVAARVKRWAAAAAIALVVHAVLYLALDLSAPSFLTLMPPGGKPVSNPVALRSIAPSEWAKNRQVGPPNPSGPSAKAPPSLPPEEKKVEHEEMPSGRIVETAPGNRQRPEKSRFLSESDNTVEKETVSRHTTPNYRNAAPVPTSPAPENDSTAGRDMANKKTVAGNEGLGQDERPMKEGGNKGAFEIPSTQAQQGLALRMNGENGEVPNRKPSDPVAGNSDRLRIKPGDANGPDSEGSQGKRGEQNVLTLTPSSAVLGRIVGAPVNDVDKNLDDLEQGEGTFLNTREWKYASFFNRVREGVSMNWNPNYVIARRDPTGQLYLFKDRYTVLNVTLDADGSVRAAVVNHSSGVDFLDKEAIAAFQRAQPFPHPPAALLDGNGEVRFNFGFMLDTGSSGLRFFR